MKIRCDREKLLAAFSIAASVAPARSPKAILQNVKMEAVGGSLILSATDMEIGVRIELPEIEVLTGGCALIPVARFGAILRESSDEKIQVHASDRGTEVRGDRSRFNLSGANPDEFPGVAPFQEDKCHEVSAKAFKDLIRRTIFATDTESSRYALGGVLLEFESSSLIAVGTDGRRLAKAECPATGIGGHTTGSTPTIVPSKSMQLIERAMPSSDETIRIAARGNDVLVKSEHVTIMSRLVEGRFPRWRDALPSRPDAIQLQLVAGPVHAAIRQAAIVASEDSRGINFTFGQGMMILSGSTAEVGDSHIELPIPYDAEPVTIAMDHRYVADFLKAVGGDQSFTLEIDGGESAALFTTEDGYGYVVMPLARG